MPLISFPYTRILPATTAGDTANVGTISELTPTPAAAGNNVAGIVLSFPRIVEDGDNYYLDLSQLRDSNNRLISFVIPGDANSGGYGEVRSFRAVNNSPAGSGTVIPVTIAYIPGYSLDDIVPLDRAEVRVQLLPVTPALPGEALFPAGSFVFVEFAQSLPAIAP